MISETYPTSVSCFVVSIVEQCAAVSKISNFVTIPSDLLQAHHIKSSSIRQLRQLLPGNFSIFSDAIIKLCLFAYLSEAQGDCAARHLRGRPLRPSHHMFASSHISRNPLPLFHPGFGPAVGWLVCTSPGKSNDNTNEKYTYIPNVRMSVLHVR